MRFPLGALLVLSATLSACGGGGTTAPNTPANTGGTGGTGGTTSAPVATNTVNATAESSFSPNSIVVSVGSTVTFVFAAVTHNVNFSGTGAPANIPNTASASVARTFATTGTFSYDCSLHSGMTGKVTVQ